MENRRSETGHVKRFSEIEKPEERSGDHKAAIELLFNFEGPFKKEYPGNGRDTYGGVAQLGEHLPCKQGVMGSNPIISTMGQA